MEQLCFIDGNKQNIMLEPKREYHVFLDDAEKLEKLKELGIISNKSTKLKSLLYKGIYCEHIAKCEVIGYVDNNEIIIRIENCDKLHSIHPDYLKDMQSKSF